MIIFNEVHRRIHQRCTFLEYLAQDPLTLVLSLTRRWQLWTFERLSLFFVIANWQLLLFRLARGPKKQQLYSHTRIIPNCFWLYPLNFVGFQLCSSFLHCRSRKCVVKLFGFQFCGTEWFPITWCEIYTAVTVTTGASLSLPNIHPTGYSCTRLFQIWSKPTPTLTSATIRSNSKNMFRHQHSSTTAHFETGGVGRKQGGKTFSNYAGVSSRLAKILDLCLC